MSKSTRFDIVFAQVAVESLKGHIIRNPNYGGNKAGIHGWCWRPELSSARKPEFMKALSESIREEGFRNPIVVYATSEGNFVSFGGSRALCARRLGLRTIPALVNDYCGRYESCPEVTPKNAHTFFKDVPQYIEFTPEGIDTHYSMERNRRNSSDPAGYAWMPKDAAWVANEFPWLSWK